MKFYLSVRDWSEMWAYLIPLAVIFAAGHKISGNFRLIRTYVFIGLLLNTISTTLFVFHSSMPSFLYNNNILYNIHSITRVVFFSLFLYRNRIFKAEKLMTVILSAYILFVLINFFFFNSFLNFSTPLLLAETVVLITFTTSYFYHAVLQDDDEGVSLISMPSFLLNAGLLVFEAVNFFVYLLYTPIGYSFDTKVKKLFWTINCFSLVLFCIVIAISLHRSAKNKPVNE